VSLSSDRSELVGFFSYSRDDDQDATDGLSALRDRIQRELRGQLGLPPGAFRLWQDREAIAPGTLWEAEINAAVGKSVFFIPIITPTAVRSPFCRFEFQAFLRREKELGRNDLVFPILYIRVPALEVRTIWEADDVLSVIGHRQYVDWRQFRHQNVTSTAYREAIEQFCSKIVDALNRPTAAQNGTAAAPEQSAHRPSRPIRQVDGLKQQNEKVQAVPEALAAAAKERSKSRSFMLSFRIGRSGFAILASTFTALGAVFFVVSGLQRGGVKPDPTVAPGAIIKTAMQSVARAKAMTPAEVAAKFLNATVFVEFQWRLYDRESLKPIFQKTVLVDGELWNCYVNLGTNSLGEPRIVRWLTTEDEGRTNVPIGSGGWGSGFVVTEDGYVLTSKHVAASWMTEFNSGYEARAKKGLVFPLRSAFPTASDTGKVLPSGQYVAAEARKFSFSRAPFWQPDWGGIIFDSQYAVATNNGDERSFVGKNEVLTVRFPDSSMTINAELVRSSMVADVALLKISAPQKLSHVELATPDDVVAQGAPITVLGYSGTLAEAAAIAQTQQAGNLRSRLEQVPDPTVTSGVVSLVRRRPRDTDSITVIGSWSDAYQLTAGASAGNIGGPVFDATGMVIAIFTHGPSGTESTNWAVPIRYGRALLDVQQQ
jgi:S1-C subfamily serine protease